MVSHPVGTLSAWKSCSTWRSRPPTRAPTRGCGGRLLDREEREAELDAALAPGATRPVGAGKRELAEEPDPYRLCFERDLDRVKHSRPWRRLAGKCQVFIAPEDDHLRTRLTHAVEVAQVATGIARVGQPVRAARRGDRPRPRLRPRSGRSRVGGGLLARTSPVDGYDHAVYGADVTLAPLNLCARDARRRAQPLVAPSGAVHSRGRGGGLGRSHRLRLPRLRRRRAGRDPRARRPARPRSRDVVGTRRSAADRRFVRRGARRDRAGPARSG